MRRLAPFILLCLAFLATGCRGSGRERGRPATTRPSTLRVVSFSPALTQLILDLGLGDRLVGVTSYCELPEGMDVPAVGDQLNIRAEPIMAVEPDLVLAQAQLERFESLRQIAPQIDVRSIRIESLSEIGAVMETVGAALGAPEKGREARAAFESRLRQTRELVAGLPRPRTVFVMGHQSPAVAGRGTFLDDLIETAGGVNAIAERYEGWKRVSVEAVLSLQPDVLICQTGPAEAQAAREYWEQVLDAGTGSDVRVYVVTDRGWTIPTADLARQFLGQLVGFLHPNLAGGVRR